MVLTNQANANLMLRTPEAFQSFRNLNLGSTSTLTQHTESIEVVVFSKNSGFVGAVMLGLKPAIEGDEGTTVEVALRKLMTATAEILSMYIPKVGSHQRNIHGGGIFDEDMITAEIKEAKRLGG